MENPYFTLHRDFRDAGADVLISSGQALVIYGVSAFSKDGDWIIRERKKSCCAVLRVLSSKGASYRLGAPLDPAWLRKGWTSHFEYIAPEGERIRVDFCSRPPRVKSIRALWADAVRHKSADVVDIVNLISLKQTRRIRDYHMIGSLAYIAGFVHGVPEIALENLQDVDLLVQAVKRWPKQAAACRREAVMLACARTEREKIIASLSKEQDRRIRDDAARIQMMRKSTRFLAKRFTALRNQWKRHSVPLLAQHNELMLAAKPLLAGE